MARKEKRQHPRRRRFDSFDRRVRNRDIYKDLLIVCEGKKTEPNYFWGLALHLRLPNVKPIQLKEKSTPKQIARVAYEELCNHRDKYAAVFCVYDVDEDSRPMMESAADAGQFVRTRPKIDDVLFKAIPSTPCFEIWFLLHFGRSDKPYAKTGSKSAQYQLMADLRRHLPEYDKSRKDIFEYLEGRCPNGLETAIANAQWLCKRPSTTNPHTLVHEVVSYMLEHTAKG